MSGKLTEGAAAARTPPAAAEQLARIYRKAWNAARGSLAHLPPFPPDETSPHLEALLAVAEFAAVQGAADSRRLDWIEAKCGIQTHEIGLTWPNMNGHDLRDDIDAEMKSEETHNG